MLIYLWRRSQNQSQNLQARRQIKHLLASLLQVDRVEILLHPSIHSTRIIPFVSFEDCVLTWLKRVPIQEKQLLLRSYLTKVLMVVSSRTWSSLVVVHDPVFSLVTKSSVYSWHFKSIYTIQFKRLFTNQQSINRIISVFTLLRLLAIDSDVSWKNNFHAIRILSKRSKEDGHEINFQGQLDVSNKITLDFEKYSIFMHKKNLSRLLNKMFSN